MLPRRTPRPNHTYGQSRQRKGKCSPALPSFRLAKVSPAHKIPPISFQPVVLKQIAGAARVQIKKMLSPATTESTLHRNHSSPNPGKQMKYLIRFFPIAIACLMPPALADNGDTGDNSDTDLIVFFSQAVIPNGAYTSVHTGGGASSFLETLAGDLIDEFKGATISIVGEFPHKSQYKYTNNANLYKFEMSGADKCYAIIYNAGPFSGKHQIDDYWGEVNQLSSNTDSGYNNVYIENLRILKQVAGREVEIRINPPRFDFDTNIRNSTLESIQRDTSYSVEGMDIEVNIRDTGDNGYADGSIHGTGATGHIAFTNLETVESDSVPAYANDQDYDGYSDDIDPYPTNPLHDSDGDGFYDDIDVFPNDATETADADNDGTGDNADAFPNDPTETADTDNDGTGNNADTDDDGDGIDDGLDAFPIDNTESVDTDGDGTGNNADTDDDGDGVADGLDVFPLDAAESVDTDGDGTGNNADTDDDNDGVSDVLEARVNGDPLDPSDGDDVEASIINDMDSNEGTIQELQSQNASLEGTVSSNETEIASLESTVSSNETEIATLSQRPTLQEVRDGRPGSVLLTVDSETGSVVLDFTVEESEDLTNWTPVAGPGVSQTLTLPEGKRFYRFAH